MFAAEKHLIRRKLPMKKLLLIPFLALAFGACSTDTDIEELETARSAQREMPLDSPQSPNNKGQFLSCFSGLKATTFISTANGINNPTITFVSQPPASATGSYVVKVEMEELRDCEDLTAGSGNVRLFTTGLSYVNVFNNPPQVTGITPAQTFMCYRWRMKFEAVNRYGDVTCISSTEWYDAPLF
jgi:hypothetical protein